MPVISTQKISDGTDVTLKGYLTNIANSMYPDVSSYEEYDNNLKERIMYAKTNLEICKEKLETLNNSTVKDLIFIFNNKNQIKKKKKQEYTAKKAAIRNNYIKVYNELEQIQITKELIPFLTQAYADLKTSLDFDSPIDVFDKESVEQTFNETNIFKYKSKEALECKRLIEYYEKEIEECEEIQEEELKTYKAIYDLIDSL